MNSQLDLVLDIDGVLNSESSFKYYYEIWKYNKHVEMEAPIDEQRVLIFKDLCQEIEKMGYNVHIILSSTWRNAENLVEMVQTRLGKHDLEIENQTPYIPATPRGEEIRVFCQQHHISKESVLILDDHDDMDDYIDRLIQTYDRDGLTYRDSEIAIALLLKTNSI